MKCGRFYIFSILLLLSIAFFSCTQIKEQKEIKSVSDELIESAQNNLASQRLNEAAYEYSKFMEFYPEDDRYSEALYRLAYIQVVQSEYDSARTLFGNLLEQFPDNKWRFSAKTWKQTLDNLVEAKAKTKTKKVYIEKNNKETAVLLNKCEEEKNELRSRIKKLESIIEGEP